MTIRAEVAEWQTRRSQTPLRATSSGFESRLRHHTWHLRGTFAVQWDGSTLDLGEPPAYAAAAHASDVDLAGALTNAGYGVNSDGSLGRIQPGGSE